VRRRAVFRFQSCTLRSFWLIDIEEPAIVTVTVERIGRVTMVTLSRPEVRNAVDSKTAQQLATVFREFDNNSGSDVAVFYGDHGIFCAGADLKAISMGLEANDLSSEGDGPMGPSRMQLSKPVIAAIAGHAVAGGLELALWCDLRVVEENATLGVFCRRWGVPLIDGGTVRLPRLIGHARAMDLILTGRAVDANEALHIGLASRVVPAGESREAALALAEELCHFPQNCLRSDRLSACEQWGMSLEDAMANEFQRGLDVIASRETLEGAMRFASGKGRHGEFENM
jgi:enoyl-CoA hydratase